MSGPTARLWVLHKGSPVRITLTAERPEASFGDAGRTEEGWYREGESLWLEKNDNGLTCVFSERWTGERDCDGRHSTRQRAFCPLYLLKAGYRESATVAFPVWNVSHASQRDYSAEAAGY